jgi:hypothetical protein
MTFDCEALTTIGASPDFIRVISHAPHDIRLCAVVVEGGAAALQWTTALDAIWLDPDGRLFEDPMFQRLRRRWATSPALADRGSAAIVTIAAQMSLQLVADDAVTRQAAMFCGLRPMRSVQLLAKLARDGRVPLSVALQIHAQLTQERELYLGALVSERVFRRACRQ